MLAQPSPDLPDRRRPLIRAKPRLAVVLILFAIFTTPVLAELSPEPKLQAELLVTSVVGKRYTNTDSVQVNYLLEIERVHELKRQGRPIRGIARELGLSRAALKRYLRQTSCPD
jgi:hypothetical protein